MTIRMAAGTMACLIMFPSETGRATVIVECDYVDTTFEPGTEQAAGPYRVLNIWARDSSGTDAVPTWAMDLWDTTRPANLPMYWSDVTFGSLQFRGENVFDADSPALYLTIDTTLRIIDSIADSLEPIGLRADSPYYDRSPGSVRMMFFFNRVMHLVDDQVDLGVFDTDNNGTIDYINLFISTGGGPIGYNGARNWPVLPYYTHMSTDTNSHGNRVRSGSGSTYYNMDEHPQKQLFGLVVHEMGHLGPRTSWYIPDRYNRDYPCLGGYDVYTTYSFNRDWPSPLLPWDVVYRLKYDVLDTVESSTFAATIDDRLSHTGSVMALAPEGTTYGQMFLTSLHLGQNIWEASWPAFGVMITHVSNFGSQTAVALNRYWREQKIEWGSGLYLWDTIATPDTIHGEYIARYAIIDSTQPDAAAGLDSMDFWNPWVTILNQPFEEDTILDAGVGSANQMWGTQLSSGRKWSHFTEYTNPSSKFYSDTTGPKYRQQQNLRVAITNITVDTASATATADFLYNAWSGTVTSNTTWSGQITASGDIVVPEGVTLTLSPGTDVIVRPYGDIEKTGDSLSVEIKVHGSLIANGTPSQPIRFRSYLQSNDSLSWRGITVEPTGHANFTECRFEDMSHGVRVEGADSVTFNNCTLDDVGYVALSIECADTGGGQTVPEGTVISDCTFLNGALANSCGIVVDTGTSASITHVTLQAIPNAILFRQSSGSLRDVLITSADTALYADILADSTLTCDQVDFTAYGITKGIAARGGTIIIDSSSIYADNRTALDAFTGTATVRASNSEFYGSPSTSAAVSIGPNARLVATNCYAGLSWIGMEIYGKQADSIIGCRFINNEVYGLRFDTSNVTDYTFGNYIANDTASPINMGYYVNRQGIYSVADTIMGGYNWGFNFYSATLPNLRAFVEGLCMKGKPGDTWGVVLNGPSSSWDSAFVIESTVDSVFGGAHLYMRWLYAYIADCTFRSPLSPQSSSPYGIQDRGDTYGRVRCTKVLNFSQACIRRYASSSAINYGKASSSFLYGNNSIYVTDTLALPATYYFKNDGGDSVKAEKNWWGKATPKPARFAGPVDYTPTLTAAPLCAYAKVAAGSAEEHDEVQLPAAFALGQNYPNPFNPVTTIAFQLPNEQRVRIDVFNTLGRLVKSTDLGQLPAGMHSFVWDGRDHTGRVMGSGVYLYRIATPEYVETKKMVLLK